MSVSQMCCDEQRCVLARAVYSMQFIFCANQLGTANTPNAAALATATAEIAVVAAALAITVAAAMLAQHQQ